MRCETATGCSTGRDNKRRAECIQLPTTRHIFLYNFVLILEEKDQGIPFLGHSQQILSHSARLNTGTPRPIGQLAAAQTLDIRYLLSPTPSPARFLRSWTLGEEGPLLTRSISIMPTVPFASEPLVSATLDPCEACGRYDNINRHTHTHGRVTTHRNEWFRVAYSSAFSPSNRPNACVARPAKRQPQVRLHTRHGEENMPASLTTQDAIHSWKDTDSRVSPYDCFAQRPTHS